MVTTLRILMAALVALVLAGAAPANAPSLDGKTFTGSLLRETAKEDEKAIPDTFVFANGTFYSRASNVYGFGAGAYTAKPDGSFDATIASALEGTMRWSGRVTGNRLTGTALWMKPGQSPIRYAIEGKLRE